MSWLLELGSPSTRRSTDHKIPRPYFSEVRFTMINPVPGQLLFIIHLVLKKEILLDA